MEVVEILRKARSRLLRPNGWTQSAFARSRTGREVRLGSPRATRWCAHGAIVSVSAGVADDDVRCEAVAAVSNIVGGNLIYWNDRGGRRKREVIELFDEAIMRAEPTGHGSDRGKDGR